MEKIKRSEYNNKQVSVGKTSPTTKRYAKMIQRVAKNSREDSQLVGQCTPRF
jgi:hypothetical protein